MIITPITSPALNALKIVRLGKMVFCNSGVTNVSAKYPYTIVGTPARTSRAGFSQRRRRVEAYSLRKIAASSPTGSATAMAIAVVSNVPAISTMMPNWGLTNAADHVVAVRKSTMETSRKKFIVSKSKTKTIPKVVNTEIYAHAANTPFIARSRKCLIRLSRPHSSSSDRPLCFLFSATLLILPSLRYCSSRGQYRYLTPNNWEPIGHPYHRFCLLLLVASASSCALAVPLLACDDLVGSTARRAILPALTRPLQDLVGERNILSLLDERVDVIQIKAHEVLDRGVLL